MVETLGDCLIPCTIFEIDFCRLFFGAISGKVWVILSNVGDTCKVFGKKNVLLFETHLFTNSRFDKYSIRKSMIPKFLSLSWVKKILNTGKSINFLRCVCDDSTSNITNREKGIKSSKNLLEKMSLPKRPFTQKTTL